MNRSTHGPNGKVIKLCPKCAMEHLGRPQIGQGNPSRGDGFGDRCSHCMASVRRLYSSKDVTLGQILAIVYRILMAAFYALAGLALAMLPLAELVVLLIIYTGDCVVWTVQEKNISMCLAKGAVSVVTVLLLAFVTFFLIQTLMFPFVHLLAMLFNVIRSYL